MTKVKLKSKLMTQVSIKDYTPIYPVSCNWEWFWTETQIWAENIKDDEILDLDAMNIVTYFILSLVDHVTAKKYLKDP